MRPAHYTGEVAATMVAEFGSRVAMIVGHSERRTLYTARPTRQSRTRLLRRWRPV